MSDGGIRNNFPFATPGSPLKRWLKAKLGLLLAHLMPGRAQRLLTEGDPQHFSLLDRIILNSIADQAKKSGSPEVLAQMHQVHRRFWEGDGARLTHIRNHDEVLDWFGLGDQFALSALRRQLATGRYHTLCEIGCGAGMLLEFLQQQLPQPLQLIGLDLSAEQIRINRTRGAPGLRYESGNAVEWLQKEAGPGWILLANGGVFEYFLPAELSQMFGHFAGKAAPAGLVLVEPVAHDHDFATAPESRVFGREQTFSHNYAQLARRAGFEVTAVNSDCVFGNLRWTLLAAEAPP